MKTMLNVDHVSISYKIGDFKDIGLKEWTMRHLKNNYQVETFMAVNDVSFELQEGDMFGIIGTNGAGKSTLLKAITGVMEPRSGRIERNGRVVALLELASGFDSDLTVKENAYLRGAMLGYTREFMDETYQQILDFSELWKFEDRPFKQLSTGMQSRLAFSIASMVQPEILVLDEVLSVGDGAFQEKSAKKMMEIIHGGAATILVSHSLDQVRELCNKVLWLDHGNQIAFGKTKQICDAYEAFLSSGISSASAFVGQYQRQESLPHEDILISKEGTGMKKKNGEAVCADMEPTKREDAINAYRLFLGREPESEEVVQGCVNVYGTIGELRRSFIQSKEFQDFFYSVNKESDKEKPETAHGHDFAEVLLSDPELLSKLRFQLSMTRCLWGDPARLHIDPTAVLNDALLNTNCGTITIGAYSFTGHGVSILTGTHYMERRNEERMKSPSKGNNIVIGKGVWLASGSTILGPCKIGDDAVVAGGAVVVPGTEIPAGTLWGGNPAIQIRKLDL